MRIDILSLFPHYFRGPFDESIIRRAKERGLIDLCLTDLRDFAKGVHHQVDDRPYGGGPGMVLMAPPVVEAIEAVSSPQAHVVYLSPQGQTLNAQMARRLAKQSHLVLLCGHYEGIDERVVHGWVDEEVSIGDYVLTNGCLAAIVLVDALVRYIPGVIGHELSARQDSFEEKLFDCPSYTRPKSFRSQEVPTLLLEGDHRKIEQWKLAKAIEKTGKVRPDLLAKYIEERWPKTQEDGLEIALFVEDYDRAKQFYKKALGWSVEEVGEKTGLLKVARQNLLLLEGKKEGSYLRLQCEKTQLDSIERRCEKAKITHTRWVSEAREVLQIRDPDDHHWSFWSQEKGTNL